MLADLAAYGWPRLHAGAAAIVATAAALATAIDHLRRTPAGPGVHGDAPGHDHPDTAEFERGQYGPGRTGPGRINPHREDL